MAALLLWKYGAVLLMPRNEGVSSRIRPAQTGTASFSSHGRGISAAPLTTWNRAQTSTTRRLAFYGLSTGGDAGIILTALESRLEVSVLQGTGLWDEPTPEIDPRNYAPRVQVPTLMVNGRYDFDMPYETAQRPLFELLGVPPQHKRHVAAETGHAVPTGDLVSIILPWLDRHLGPAR